MADRERTRVEVTELGRQSMNDSRAHVVGAAALVHPDKVAKVHVLGSHVTMSTPLGARGNQQLSQ